MNYEQLSEYAMEIVVNAGNARSQAIQAVQCAREQNFALAEDFLQQAKESHSLAHKVQSQLIMEDMQALENNTPQLMVNLLMVHAQDHLTMALMAQDNAKEFIEIYKKIGA